MLATFRGIYNKSRVLRVRYFCRTKFPNFAAIESMNPNTTPLLYHSVDSVLEVFNKPEYNNTNGVKELLEVYKNAHDRKKKLEAVRCLNQHPLIVLEGLDGSGKTTIGKRVAKKLKAEAWRTPPNSISHLRHLFDNHSLLRTAYYCLGNYVAALEVQTVMYEKPVVMDRFWHSTAAYAIAQAVQDFPDQYGFPSEGDNIYCWPTDLLKPNIVLLLEVSEHVRLERHSRRHIVTTQENLLKSSTQFRQNVLQAYKNMYNPGVEVINGDYSFGSVLKQIERKVEHLFN